MSFKKFIYYCTVMGGLGALIAWSMSVSAGWITRNPLDALVQSTELRAALIAGVVGMFVAVAVGEIDARLNDVGWGRRLRGLCCLVGGLLGGFLGGLLGEVLRKYLHVPSVVGWILVGLAIGAALALYDLVRALARGQSMRLPLRKLRNGMLGGFLGGFLGGLPFTLLMETEALRPLYDGLPLGSLAIALVILGMCIGLLIGLAQVVLMEAWLRVEAGFRPGRQLLLSKDETTIGRAESCDVGLFGDGAVEKLHARILRRDNRYVLADAGTPGGTFLNDEPVGKPAPLRSGDVIRVGKCVLRFGERQKRKR
jgi:hypothetical protein